MMPAVINTLPKKLEKDLARAAIAVKSAKNAEIITHIDADGITAGSIASITLDRLKIDHKVIFEKKITQDTIEHINRSTCDLTWICDLGSGYLSEFTRSNIIVTDHHVPDQKFRKSQTFIDDFVEIFHLNPHTYGIDGSYEICGAGMTYLLSRTIDPNNNDLAYLGIIGAVGDFQNNHEFGLVGCNRIILKDAEDNGSIVENMDLTAFGRESRPLIQYLQYCNEPEIPGITNDKDGCIQFFSEMCVPLKSGTDLRVWNDLTPEEKLRLTDALQSKIKDPEKRKTLYGEMYTLPNFDVHTGLRDCKEFATILNSCGRYDDAETGLKICKGDMTALKDAERNRIDHRRNISSALSYVKDNHLIRERKFIQYFDAESEIRETVVGIVAGMLLTSGDIRPELPMIAFANSNDGVKVSARSIRALTDRGLDLSFIMKKASEMVGGYGGGHNIAAGATIPEDKKEAFLEIVEDLVSAQII